MSTRSYRHSGCQLDLAGVHWSGVSSADVLGIHSQLSADCLTGSATQLDLPSSLPGTTSCWLETLLTPQQPNTR